MPTQQTRWLWTDHTSTLLEWLEETFLRLKKLQKLHWG